MALHASLLLPLLLLPLLLLGPANATVCGSPDTAGHPQLHGCLPCRNTTAGACPVGPDGVTPCSGHGECVLGGCSCTAPFSGAACATEVVPPGGDSCCPGTLVFPPAYASVPVVAGAAGFVNVTIERIGGCLGAATVVAVATTENGTVLDAVDVVVPDMATVVDGVLLNVSSVVATCDSVELHLVNATVASIGALAIAPAYPSAACAAAAPSPPASLLFVDGVGSGVGSVSSSANASWLGFAAPAVDGHQCAVDVTRSHSFAEFGDPDFVDGAIVVQVPGNDSDASGACSSSVTLTVDVPALQVTPLEVRAFARVDGKDAVAPRADVDVEYRGLAERTLHPDEGAVPAANQSTAFLGSVSWRGTAAVNGSWVHAYARFDDLPWPVRRVNVTLTFDRAPTAALTPDTTATNATVVGGNATVVADNSTTSVWFAAVGVLHGAAEMCKCAPGRYAVQDADECRFCPSSFVCRAGVLDKCTGNLHAFGGASECAVCPDGWVCDDGFATPCAHGLVCVDCCACDRLV